MTCSGTRVTGLLPLTIRPLEAPFFTNRLVVVLLTKTASLGGEVGLFLAEVCELLVVLRNLKQELLLFHGART